ncbi:MAG TPA: glycoside hydrolase family 104 protein [Burkholderiaceae bacterium]|nr:glycoside hydrolase family 104 protein [Burkholderiaceae bacterium]
MNAPAVLLLTTSAALLIASRRQAVGAIEAGDADLLGGFSVDALTGRAEAFINVITEQPAAVDMDTAQRNIQAALYALRRAEGTEGRGDPYRVCYGYSHTIMSFADHPAVTGEWRGVVLPEAMCRNAGFGPGCKSTAAGAYQIIKPTWIDLKRAMRLPDFSPASQDAAAVELIRRQGALEDVKAGRFAAAMHKCRQVWASLPGNYAKQGQRSIGELSEWYASAGGAFA